MSKHHHDPFGAPHFPPSENLPPQAKRLAELKKKRAAKAADAPAPSKAPHHVKAKAFPDALPNASDAKAAVGQVWHDVAEKAEPVLTEARDHASGAVSAAKEIAAEAKHAHVRGIGPAARNFGSELMGLLRIPGALFKLVFQARKA